LKQVSIKNEFLSLKVLNYGAIIQECLLTDSSDGPVDLVVGLEDPAEYLSDSHCLGACVGRFAGRISGSFQLDGKTYPLHTVVKNVHLHGGKEGFSKKYWEIEEVLEGTEPSITLSYTSRHMEEGYPGTLKATVTYALRDRSLLITHQATSDRKTVVNLVNHSYFLLGHSESVRDYRLQLNSQHYLETKDNLLPTGRILPVEGTPYDFSRERKLGKTLLDTPFIINSGAEQAAEIFNPASGIRMCVKSNQPGLVVYTPPRYDGICFETQNLPDAPNMPHFPNSILEPGKLYLNSSEFLFDRP